MRETLDGDDAEREIGKEQECVDGVDGDLNRRGKHRANLVT